MDNQYLVTIEVSEDRTFSHSWYKGIVSHPSMSIGYLMVENESRFVRKHVISSTNIHNDKTMWVDVRGMECLVEDTKRVMRIDWTLIER